MTPFSPLSWISDVSAPRVRSGDHVVAKFQLSHRDTAYAVHAANAYPRLVEALKRASETVANGVEQQAIATLLRELGEAA